MNTPIFDFVYRYTQSDTSRLHMPGHKGQNLLGCEALDITEIDGADELYHAKGIIAESEKNASCLFGSRATFYSAEGSSLCIRAMLYMALKMRKNKAVRPCIAASRNSHKVFVLTAALLDFDILWLYGKGENPYSCELCSDDVENALKDAPEGLCGVYITSPDYLGKFCDIKGIAKVCHNLNLPLLVDNAHGAYLKFLRESRHPLDLGADMCCDSAHKTLPCLTGGAYLHVSQNSLFDFDINARQAMSVFASTSPSYLILQSLDLVNRYTFEHRDDFLKTAEKCKNLKAELKHHGYTLVSDEPFKVTLAPKKYGYTGNELCEHLRKHGCEPEFCDNDFVVLMFSTQSLNENYDRVKNCLLSLDRRCEIQDSAPKFSRAVSVMSPHDALLADSECIQVHQSKGRILSAPNVSCPPAVPFVVCGEVIDESAVCGFEYYGINEVLVVKE